MAAPEKLTRRRKSILSPLILNKPSSTNWSHLLRNHWPHLHRNHWYTIERNIQTISDYGRTSPVELICAYTPVKYLYQQLQLSSFKIEGALLFLGSISFETTGQICHLAKSESFFLKSEIIKGKSYNQKFDEKYKIGYWNENAKREVIVTDGRFYKFSDRTTDIGYNFLKQNKLTEKFKNKNQYD